MNISSEDIARVAHLARLALRPDEIETMTHEVGRILTYIDTLNELNTEGVIPTSHALAITNAFREDAVVPSLAREEALKNAPRRNKEAFVVPKIIG